MSDDQREPELKSESQRRQPEQKIDQQSDDQGFYNRGDNQEQSSQKPLEDPGKKMRKIKHIKKRKRRGQSTKKQAQQKKKKEHLVAANEEAKKIINQMRSCYQKDMKLYEAKKKANHMFKYSLELQKQLRNIYVCQQFLQNGGLQYFEPWIRKLPDGADASLTLKKKVFNIILSLNANQQHIDRAPELKKLIQKNKKNPNVKQLCEAIITKWGNSSML